jgi:hypothetical protein
MNNSKNKLFYNPKRHSLFDSSTIPENVNNINNNNSDMIKASYLK